MKTKHGMDAAAGVARTGHHAMAIAGNGLGLDDGLGGQWDESPAGDADGRPDSPFHADRPTYELEFDELEEQDRFDTDQDVLRMLGLDGGHDTD